MKLYKNVDICDIKSILESGILPISETGNDNWEDGKRGNNSKDVVYLFEPIEYNYFPQYGIALLECDVDVAVDSEIKNNDVNFGKYKEYILNRVNPDCIKKIMIPSVFKEKILNEYPELQNIDILWGRMEADIYSDDGLRKATQEEIELLKNRPLNTCEYGYMRGINQNNEVVDYYNVMIL